MSDDEIPANVLRCPIHGIPDCSPLLNGCSIPNRLAGAYKLGINEGRRLARVAEQHKAVR